MGGQKPQQLLPLSDGTLVSNLDGKIYPADSQVLPDGKIDVAVSTDPYMQAAHASVGGKAHKGSTHITKDEVFGINPAAYTNIKADLNADAQGNVNSVCKFPNHLHSHRTCFGHHTDFGIS